MQKLINVGRAISSQPPPPTGKMFLSTAPYIYEVHTAHLPSASFEALSYVFYRAYATKSDIFFSFFLSWADLTL